MTEEKKKFFNDIISAKNLAGLIDQKEDICFEAKSGTGYDLDTADGRYELAKDISSFANSEGGFLFLGLKQEPVITENTDRIVGLDLIKEDDFSVSKYRGVIDEHVFPKIIDVEFGWIESSENLGFGIAYIFIPEQSESKKYFLIKNVVDSNQLVRGIVFGMAQRFDSSNTPLTIAQLHKKIQQGKSSLTERLTRIEDKLETIDEHLSRPTKRSPVDKLEDRLSQIEKI